jgi:hypothetical protein
VHAIAFNHDDAAQLGMDISDSFEPIQSSARGSDNSDKLFEAELSKSPTAMHSAALKQATPTRSPPGPSIDHLAPFQCSTTPSTAAVQLAALVQVIAPCDTIGYVGYVPAALGVPSHSAAMTQSAAAMYFGRWMVIAGLLPGGRRFVEAQTVVGPQDRRRGGTAS